jgi:hypothetical protein
LLLLQLLSATAAQLVQLLAVVPAAVRCSSAAAPALAAARCSAVAAPAVLSAAHFSLLIFPAHFLSTHSSLKHSLPDPLHKGGEADMRPLSLVEVNQAILAWSFYTKGFFLSTL